jgi:hypothetical protein
MYREDQSFQIRIPKEFIKEGWPDRDKLDFVLWLIVHYFFNAEKEMVISVDMLFDLGAAFTWDNPRFKQYLQSACENQWLNNHPNLLDELSPELIN